MKILEVIDDPTPQEDQGIFSSPKGFYGPGIIANLSSKLQKMVGHPSPESPQQNYNRVVPPLETIADIAGGFAAPGKTFLQRILSAGAVPAAISGIGGKGLGDMALQGGLGAATQGVLEPIMGIIKQPFMRRAANQLMAEHGQQVVNQEAQYAKALADHTGNAAMTIMQDAKSKVPAWASFPTDVSGLADLVAGKGQHLLSESFDKSLQAIKEKAAGTLIKLPVDDIKKLGVPLEGIVESATKPGALLIGQADAALVAEAITGKGSKDPSLYRRVVNALDAENLGDPVARAEYKAGQGFIRFLDKTKALSLNEIGNPTLDTQKILKGLTPVKVVDELRKRELGDVFTGPFNSAKGQPMAPPELPAPDIGSVKLPGRAASASIGAGAAGGLGYFAGMGLHPGAAITGTGALLGALRPDEIITRVPGPLGNQVEQAASGLAQGGGGVLRDLLGELLGTHPPMQDAE